MAPPRCSPKVCACLCMCELMHVCVQSGHGCVSMCVYVCVCAGSQFTLVTHHHWPSAAHHSCWGLPRLSLRPLWTGSCRSPPALEVRMCGPSSALKASRVIWGLVSAGIWSCGLDPVPQGAHKSWSLLVSWKPAMSMRNTLLFYLQNTKGFLHAGSIQAFENKVSWGCLPRVCGFPSVCLCVLASAHVEHH